MTAVLQLDGVTAGYAGIPAVRDLDLRVAEGEVLALLGPNGAGKTTTLLTAAGVIRPMRGTVAAFGRPLHRRLERNARAGLILVPDTRAVFHGLTVRENLALARRDGLDRVLELFPALAGLMSRRCGLLSGGEQQMLAIAKALAGPAAQLRADRHAVAEAYFGTAPTTAPSSSEAPPDGPDRQAARRPGEHLRHLRTG